MMEDSLMSVLPEDILMDIVSRLYQEDACILKCVSKSWRSRISLSYVMKLRRRPPLLVLTGFISQSTSTESVCRCKRPNFFIADNKTHPPLLPPLSSGGEEEVKKTSFNCDKVVFKHLGGYSLGRYNASCRDLICFYTDRSVYVYSPSTAQYLYFDCHSCLESRIFEIGIVYIASIKVYKIVRIELFRPDGRGLVCGPGRPKTVSVRFKAITVHGDDEDDDVDHECDVVNDDDEQSRTSWELISEHTLPFEFESFYGNLIGVSGVVYTLITSEPCRTQVLSLDIMEDDNKSSKKKKKEKLKIFDIPKVACPIRTTLTLSQVKDVLCLPEATASSIVLWLLQDRNTGTWFKGYTISYIPPTYMLKEVVYYPAITSHDDDDGGGGGCDDGMFLFKTGPRLIQYDIRTKEAGYILVDAWMQQLHVFSGRLFSLKNGLRCPRVPTDIHSPGLNCEMPPPPVSFPSLPRCGPPPLPQGPLPSPPSPPPRFRRPPPPPGPLPPPPPPPQGSLPPPPPPSDPPLPQGSLPPPPRPRSDPPPPQGSLPPPHSHPPPPQGFLPRPPALPHPYPKPPQNSFPPPLTPYSHHQPPQGFIPPPPPHSYPQLPLSSLQTSLPPPYSHFPMAQGLPHSYPQPPQGSLPPMLPPPYSHPPTPQGSLPPPPYYHHNLQHTAYWITPHPPLPQGLPPPPPPPPPFNSQNFQYQIYSPEVKKRKLHS